MKKILTILTALVVTIMTCAAVVSAASSQDDIITALQDAGVPDTYIATAEDYMAQSDITMTPAQVDSVIANIDNASAITGGEVKFSNMSADQKTQVIAEVGDAANTMGLSTSYDSTTGLSISDSTGNVIVSISADSGAVKQTGFDYTIVFAGLALIVLAGVSTIIVRKSLSREKKIIDAA